MQQVKNLLAWRFNNGKDQRLNFLLTRHLLKVQVGILKSDGRFLAGGVKYIKWASKRLIMPSCHHHLPKSQGRKLCKTKTPIR